MLWMLALAAAAGILAIFFSTNVMSRVAGTAFVAAIGVLLAIPASRQLDEEKSSAGATLSLGAVVLGFVLAAAAIWVELLAGWRWQEELAFTSFIITAFGLTAGPLLTRTRIPAARLASLVALSLGALAAALFLVEIWYGTSNGKLAVTGGFILSSGTLAALALTGLGTDKPESNKLWRWLGVLSAAVALTLGFLGTWFVQTYDPTWYVVAISIALVIAYTNVLIRLPLGDHAPLVRILAVGSLAATAALICVMSFITHGFNTTPDQMLIKVAGAGGVTTACAALGVVVLYRLNRKTTTSADNVAEVTSVALTCPHCGREQSVLVGESGCPGCGLVFTLKVREPRCAKCDYPLLGIKGSVCPECGAPRQAAPTLRSV